MLNENNKSVRKAVIMPYRFDFYDNEDGKAVAVRHQDGLELVLAAGCQEVYEVIGQMLDKGAKEETIRLIVSLADDASPEPRTMF